MLKETGIFLKILRFIQSLFSSTEGYNVIRLDVENGGIYSFYKNEMIVKKESFEYNGVEVVSYENGIAISIKYEKNSTYCKIIQKNLKWYIEDLGNSKGVLLNGNKLDKLKQHLLRDKDVILISDKKIIIILDSFFKINKYSKKFKYLFMARSMCYGRCPAYSFTVDSSNNKVMFEGKHYVGLIGKESWFIDDESIKKINNLIKKYNYFDITKINPRKHMTDFPSCALSITLNNYKTRKISHNYGRNEFPSLVDFEKEIDSIVFKKHKHILKWDRNNEDNR